MESFEDLRERSNQMGVDFLFTELETARTFLQVAETTSVEATRRRNRSSAHIAYDTLLRLAPRVTMVAEDQKRFDGELADLKEALIEVGFSL